MLQNHLTVFLSCHFHAARAFRLLSAVDVFKNPPKYCLDYFYPQQQQQSTSPNNPNGSSLAAEDRVSDGLSRSGKALFHRESVMFDSLLLLKSPFLRMIWSCITVKHREPSEP